MARIEGSSRPTDWRFSCEPQRLCGSPETPKLQCQTLPKADWNALWLVSCNRLLGSPTSGDELKDLRKVGTFDFGRVYSEFLPDAIEDGLEGMAEGEVPEA
jgi:hypothetical protein